eukprot:CAMPEP_0172529480 /NCGR_PEP_ID=MMETSP1067-20121228/3540_1 /TAXON_ID=265564 ORGANISM="Thalassiosira punctigera, Strain Tpunct2005C2" /NCGR_SAMPLE_ID=MMETSP1067 /ASSEMBLY_ACC=CAM_ASM_000444 /LENGTH=456 /DNA_ID=CAMNT_0013313531 /DNA_START=280 /DNA_END=1651 /DNA_ORIENTATION=+
MSDSECDNLPMRVHVDMNVVAQCSLFLVLGMKTAKVLPINSLSFASGIWVPLYKTRWKGYSAGDDTWEPRENVASTGHIDRYERQQRQRILRKSSAGVAVIEYEDGEREMVDMKIEKFRGHRPDSSDDERDDDTVDGDDDVNNFTLVGEGQWIEILWRHTNMYFPCKIIFWTPLRAKKSHKKGAGNSSRKGIFEDGEESSVGAKKIHKKSAGNSTRTEVFEDGEESLVGAKKIHKKSAGSSTRKEVFADGEELFIMQSKPKGLKKPSKKSKQGDDSTNRGKKQPSSVVTAESDKNSSTSRGKKRPESVVPAEADKNSQPELAPKVQPQQLSRINERKRTKPFLKTGLNEEDHKHSDVGSIDSESSGISSDDVESDPERPVERIGQGVPLFDEPEDDFSSDDDSDEDEEGEGIITDEYPGHGLIERPKLSFEDLWTLRLKRTQELMDRDTNISKAFH